MMKITMKLIGHKYIVTVNGYEFSFDDNKDAWSFIFKLREAA